LLIDQRSSCSYGFAFIMSRNSEVLVDDAVAPSLYTPIPRSVTTYAIKNLIWGRLDD